MLPLGVNRPLLVLSTYFIFSCVNLNFSIWYLKCIERPPHRKCNLKSELELTCWITRWDKFEFNIWVFTQFIISSQILAVLTSTVISHRKSILPGFGRKRGKVDCFERSGMWFHPKCFFSGQVAPKIKAMMMEKGSTMVGYQPLKEKPNFFR